MIQLPGVFSSNAVFLQNADIIFPVKLKCNSAEKVSLTLVKNCCGTVICQSSAPVMDGTASISLHTPSSSFDCYTVTVSAGEESIILENILFGEVYIASGQSNMEAQNYFALGKGQLFEKIQSKGKKIRFFAQDRLTDTSPEQNLPFKATDDLGGRWCDSSDSAALTWVSAVATQFVYDLEEYLENSGKEIPVAFINSSIGGSCIQAWLPRYLVEQDEFINTYERGMGRYPDAETWNKRGIGNYTQTTGLFNDKIAPLTGIKCSGILWYQGESNIINRDSQTFYTHAIMKLRESWADLFSQYGRGKFPIYIAGLHSYLYSRFECTLGYLNESFVNAMKADPDNFSVAPDYDLSYVWNIYENHPIHPIEKYPIGTRMAIAAIGRLYDSSYPKSAPYYDSFTIEKNRIILTVKEAGDGLVTIGSDTVRGFYICGDDNVYLPASGKIFNGNKIAVWSEYIDKPVHAAYAYAPMDSTGNVYGAHMLPLCQFATDKTGVVEISAKPYYDMSVQSVWVQAEVTDVYFNAFYRPLWKSCTEQTEFCTDTAFCRSTCSLRIFGSDTLGVTLASYPGYELDWWRFKILSADIFNLGKGNAELEIVYGDSKVIIPAKQQSAYTDLPGWAYYTFDLNGLKNDSIKHANFRFSLGENKYNTVNLDNIRLR